MNLSLLITINQLALRYSLLLQTYTPSVNLINVGIFTRNLLRIITGKLRINYLPMLGV